jgi:hypothetical protein
MKKEKGPYTIEFDILGGNDRDKFMNDFLHSADVFEEGKICASCQRLSLTIEKDVDLKILCKHVSETFKKAGGYTVFVGIKKINDKSPSIHPVWFKEGIQTITLLQEGKRPGWILFKDALTKLGYTVETDENMHVISIH